MTPRGKIAVGLVATIVVAAAAHLLNRSPILSDLGGRTAAVMAANDITDARTNWVSDGGWTRRVARISGTADAARRARTLAAVAALDGVHDSIWVDNPPESGPPRAMPPDCRRRIARIIAVTPIGFSVGGSDPVPGTDKVLDALAMALQNCPAARVEVIGHTAPTGTPLFSLALSQARAETIVDGLGRRGIDVRRLEPIGLGTTQNDARDRIEIRVRAAGTIDASLVNNPAVQTPANALSETAP